MNGSLSKWLGGLGATLITAYMIWSGSTLVELKSAVSEIRPNVQRITNDHETRIRALERASYRGMDGRIK